VWWGREPAASLRSWRLQKKAVDSKKDVAKGLHGWVEQKQPLGRRFVSSARITPSSPKWEVSRVGRLGEPHPQQGRGRVESGF
jgi:hypothetical protein